MLFGNKEDFAIEILSQDNELCMLIIWVDSKFIGNKNDQVMISIFLASLESLLDRAEGINDDYFELGSEVLKEVEKEERYDSTMVILGENFDDFIMRTFYKDEQFRLYWQLVDNPFGEYPNYPKGEQSAIVRRSSIESVLRMIKDAH